MDSGYVASHFLVHAQTQHQVDVVGPPFGSYSRQYKAGQGYDLHALVIDWDRTSVKWTPGRDWKGNPVIGIRFDKATCRACPVRQACTWAKGMAGLLQSPYMEKHPSRV